MPSYTQDQITKAGKAGSQNSIHGWGEKKGHNDDLDAFRHAFTWANLTKAYGPVVANALGRLNELNSEDELETKMDLHNNAVGIAVAQRTPQEDIAKTVAHATKAGITINDPYNGKLTDPTRPDVTSFLDSRDLFDFENQLSAENAAPAFDHDIAKAPDNPTPGVSSNTGNGMFGEDYGPNVSAEADTPDGGHDGTSGSADTSSAGNYGDGQDWSGVDFGGWGFPVVLDLGDDGIEIVTLDDSTARFDIDGDGRQQLLARVGPEDALFVYDRDGDRLIYHKD